jgi:hypothetical protein
MLNRITNPRIGILNSNISQSFSSKELWHELALAGTFWHRGGTLSSFFYKGIDNLTIL